MEINESLQEKLKFLSRISQFDKELENDFKNILSFIDKINRFEKFQNFDIKDHLVSVKELRSENPEKFNFIKDIYKNFYEEEDEFCKIPLLFKHNSDKE